VGLPYLSLLFLFLKPFIVLTLLSLHLFKELKESYCDILPPFFLVGGRKHNRRNIRAKTHIQHAPQDHQGGFDPKTKKSMLNAYRSQKPNAPAKKKLKKLESSKSHPLGRLAQKSTTSSLHFFCPCQSTDYPPLFWGEMSPLLYFSNQLHKHVSFPVFSLFGPLCSGAP
jgi:hypothetical protein